MTAPKITNVRKRNGIAGEYQISASVQYADEPADTVTFQSSVYGPPIVMITAGIPRGVFVSERVLDRCGRKLSADWVRAFFGED